MFANTRIAESIYSTRAQAKAHIKNPYDKIVMERTPTGYGAYFRIIPSSRKFMYKEYYVSYTPLEGGAHLTRGFATPEERDAFADVLEARCAFLGERDIYSD